MEAVESKKERPAYCYRLSILPFGVLERIVSLFDRIEVAMEELLLRQTAFFDVFE